MYTNIHLEDAMELLSDEYIRVLLEELSERPLSASELRQRCPSSHVTVYRRLRDLEKAGLVTKRLELRRDGHHRTMYENALKQLTKSVSEQAGESGPADPTSFGV